MRGLWFKGVASAALFGLAAISASAQNAPDVGDTNATEGRLSVGQSVSGAVEQPGDKDWYQIQLRAGQGYRFTLNATGEGEAALDPLLRLLDANGAEIGMNDDGPETLNSRLDVTPTANGVYYLEARGFAEEAVGAYTLSAAEYTQPTDSIPATAQTSARLALGAPVTGQVDFDGDTDWYAVQLRANQLYRFTLQSAASGGIPDPVLRLVNAEGEEIASNDDDGESLNSKLETMVPTAGTYYLEARNLAESGTGGYTLAGQRYTLPPDAVGNNASTRSSITAGRPVTGVLDHARDTDWYRANLRAGQTYRVQLRSAEGDNALGDPLLVIHNAQGAELQRDDDGGGGLNSAIEFEPAATGVYYIEARGFGDDATGNYELRLAQGDVPADASTDVTLSSDGDYRPGRLAPAGDSDWYAINLAQNQTVRVSLNDAPQGGVGDPLLVIHDGQGAELARDDDGGGNLNAYLEFTAPSAGRYFLEARAFNEEAQGNYVLQVVNGEIGDNADGAESIEPTGVARVSRVSGAGDKDWFAISMVEGRAYRIAADGAPENGLADPMLTLYTAEGTEVLSDDDGGVGLGARLSFIAPTSSTYYAAVSSFDGTGTGAYVVRAYDFEVPGNPGTDEMLTADGDQRTSAIDMIGDQDWYGVELTAGVTYRFSADADSESNNNSRLRDPYVAVVSVEGEEVAGDDDGGPGSNARLDYTPTSSGMVYVKVMSFENGGTGNYVLSTEKISE